MTKKQKKKRKKKQKEPEGQTFIRIIPDSGCDAPMLRGKLTAVRVRVEEARLMLKNCIVDAIGADGDESRLRLAQRLRWTLDHLAEPLERGGDDE